MAGLGPEVAKATVSIIPNMQGAQQAITSGLAGASSSAAGAASGAAGATFAAGLGAKLGALKGVFAAALPAAAVAGVSKGLFDVGAEFDEMTDTIITGTGASGDALEGLKESAEDIATTVPVSFGDAGDLVQDLNTRLGLTGDTLTTVGTQIAQVGDITGEAFDTEKFSGAMSAWGTAAEDMSGQLDYMFAISQSTGIGMNDLAGIMETSAPQMQALGYSFEDTAAMAGLLDKAGLDANSMMGKMSKGLTTLAKDGEEPAEAMKRVTEEIGGYIEKGDKAAAISKASELFGTKGANEFVAAVESGSMSIEDFADSMGDSTGIIGKTEAKTMSFSEHVGVLKNQFKRLLEPMGSAVFAGLSKVMDKITDAFGKFVDGPGKNIGKVFKSLIDFGKGVAKTFMDAFGKTATVSGFGEVIKKVAGVVKDYAAILFKILKVILPPLAKVLGTVLGGAFKVLMTIIKTAIKLFGKFADIIEKVKKAFQVFKDIVTGKFDFLGGLKIPHIDINGGEIPFGIGGMGTPPSIDVVWGAKGMILDKATLIGAGEAGREGIIPLSGSAMRPFAQAIASEMGGGGANITMNVTVNGADDPEAWADSLVRRMQLNLRSA